MAFSGYYGTGKDPTIYGIADQGQRVAFQNPNQLAEAQGLGQADFSKIITDPNFNPAGAILYPDYQKSISASTLINPQPSVNVNQALPQPDMSTAKGLVDSSAITQQQLGKFMAPDVVSEESKKTAALRNEVDALIPGLAGRSADQLAQEQAVGLPQIKGQLADINSQLLTGNAEYKQLQDAYDALTIENRGKTITMGSIVGNEAQIDFARQMKLRTKASDLGFLQARALGLQGQIEASQASVDRAVDLKHSTKLEEYEAKLKQLELVSGILDKQETKQAAALKLYLEDQKEKEKESAEKEKANIKLAIDSGISTRFYNVAGEIRNSLDGTGYTSEADFLKKTGMTVQDAQTRGLITNYTGESYSEPYLLGGDYVQKNLKTGEIRTAVNVAEGGGGTGGNSQIDQYADAVYNGTLQLNGVPQALRGQVNAKVEELKKNASSKYESEFEARLDYDMEIGKLAEAIASGELAGSPSELINALTNAYGKKISRQEIEATIYGLFGKSKPQEKNQFGLPKAVIKPV